MDIKFLLYVFTRALYLCLAPDNEDIATGSTNAATTTSAPMDKNATAVPKVTLSMVLEQQYRNLEVEHIKLKLEIEKLELEKQKLNLEIQRLSH